MRAILSIMGKELRALFKGQTALLFLALFLLSTNVAFFVASRFFARNIADLRPLFEWLPLLLIVLVSAVSMRAWAEEQRSGTLEILQTLPVQTYQLVLGKFAAGLALVAIALVGTFPIAATVGMVGPLDLGPVVGGYVGALLLAAAYLSIGLCISARTDNQVVALMGTAVVGGALYLIGAPQTQAMLGASSGSIASLFGTGSRFASIARGVIDLRDIVYYVSIAGFFLTLNVTFLERRRIDPHGLGAQRLTALWGLLALVGLNAVAANVWMHPIRSARIDLTENQDYTISTVTRTLLAELDEPLLIQGLFSERSHPKLQPLAPQLASILEEYAIAGGSRVRAEILDPSTDDAFADLLGQEYGIRPVPMPVADRNETRIVNSWFHVLVRYGDKHVVIPFDELVEIESFADDVRVRLRDPEYDLTKAVRKVKTSFASMESLVAKLPVGSRLVLYSTPDVLDAESASSLQVMKEVGEELALLGPLAFEEVDPRSDPALAQSLARDYGIQPVLSLTTGQAYYLHLVLITQGKAQPISPRGQLTRVDLTKTLESALQRAVPGQLKTVGVLTEVPEPPPTEPGRPPEPSPPPDYRILQQILAQTYEVERVDLNDGVVPETVDVLLVAKPGSLSLNTRLAIEQFLLRGGSAIILANHDQVTYDRGRFRPLAQDPALLDMLATWGATLGKGFVLDAQSAELALPVGRQMRQFTYPYWIDARSDRFATNHLALSGIPNVTLPWANAVFTDTVPDGLVAETLIRSTDRAWERNSEDLMPDLQAHPGLGFEVPSETRSYPLAATLVGRFPPLFDETTRPTLPGALHEAIAPGRLVVVGSTATVDDLILEYAASPVGRLHGNNPLLIQNLVDWAVEDTDLLSIRHVGSFDRALQPMDPTTTKNLELANYGMAGLMLTTFFIVARTRRTLPDLTHRRRT